jgi:hypothetical protein
MRTAFIICLLFGQAFASPIFRVITILKWVFPRIDFGYLESTIAEGEGNGLPSFRSEKFLKMLG